MKNLTILGCAALLSVLAACDGTEPNTLNGRQNIPAAAGAEDTVGSDTSTYNHAKESVGGENGITDTHQRQLFELTVGTPEQVAVLHAAQKVSYASLGKMLADFGVNLAATGGGGGGKTPAPATAGSLYTAGKSALGAPIYSSRTPEMSIPSTSALAKMFDIFVAAAPEIVANISKSQRCPAVVLVDAGGKITEDGITCLMGKPATPEHITLANRIVTDSGDATKGAEIAVATILAAAHISE